MLRPGHVLLQQPFAVVPELEDTEAPENYEKWKPGFGRRLQTFAIFAAAADGKDEPGLVTGDAGFEEFPDAERILGGINMKGPDYAAVARHGSFVMWGFRSLPERMTDAGRRLYLNTLAYAVAHKGAWVETLRLRPTRVDLEHTLTIFFNLVPAEHRKAMLQRAFTGEDMPAELFGDEALRKKWFAERVPFLHPADDGSNWRTADQLTVDAACKQLGVANDVPAFLDALAARLVKDAEDALANELLARYVPGVAAADFGDWLAKNREKAYFTEAGGWVWRARGERVASPFLRGGADLPDDEPVTLDAEATATALIVRLVLREGWHAYSPRAKAGKPVEVAIAEGSAFAAAGAAEFTNGESDDGVLRGWVLVKVPLRRITPGNAILVDVTYTACDEKACRPTHTVRLVR